MAAQHENKDAYVEKDQSIPCTDSQGLGLPAPIPPPPPEIMRNILKGMPQAPSPSEVPQVPVPDSQQKK